MELKSDAISCYNSKLGISMSRSVIMQHFNLSQRVHLILTP